MVNLSLKIQKVIDLLPNLISALVIFVGGLWLAGWLAQIVERALQRRQTDPEAALLVRQMTRWGLVTLATLTALQQVGFDLTALLTGLGILGFTVGFAIQDVSKNFIAGVLLLLQQPFELGDAIEVNGFSGIVQSIDLRATHLRTFDGRDVLIPNTEVFTNAIVNFSRTPRRRVSLEVGVAYDSDLRRVREAAMEAMQQIPGLLDDPAPEVAFHTFADASINLTLYFWIDTSETNPRQAKNDALEAVSAAFARHGIEIPYPIQTVHLVKE